MLQTKMNFVLGPTRVGKTTFCHFIKESTLKIKENNFSFKTEILESEYKNNKIGNKDTSKTLFPQYFEDLCDLPGFKDARGDEYNLKTLIDFYNELEKFYEIRLILLIEKQNITAQNGETFLEILEKFKNLFKITKADVDSIIIVVSKSSQRFCKKLPNSIMNMYSENYNVIIEAIKSKKIKVLPFEKPEEDNDRLNFNKFNMTNFIQALNNTPYLDCTRFRERILKKIESKLLNIRSKNQNIYMQKLVYCSSVFDTQPNKVIERIENHQREILEVKFTSQMNIHELSNISSNYLLVIDSNLECMKEVLKIEAKIIYVLLENKNKIFWKIEGKNPLIQFSKQIEKVIIGNKWMISTKNSSKIEFPSPTDNDFIRNQNFFRLESICVNGFCTEYLS